MKSKNTLSKEEKPLSNPAHDRLAPLTKVLWVQRFPGSKEELSVLREWLTNQPPLHQPCVTILDESDIPPEWAGMVKFFDPAPMPWGSDKESSA